MARPADPFALGDGPDACLLLHGLTGSPAEMRPVGEALAGAGFRAVGPVLPGHGTTPVDLYGVTRGDVIRAAESALLSLCGARRIFLCGLSMGSLLVIHLAARSWADKGLPDFSAIALLAESHLSLHAWPELGYVALDVFTCGQADPQKIMSSLEKHFRPKETAYLKIPRGRAREATASEAVYEVIPK